MAKIVTVTGEIDATEHRTTSGNLGVHAVSGIAFCDANSYDDAELMPDRSPAGIAPLRWSTAS